MDSTKNLVLVLCSKYKYMYAANLSLLASEMYDVGHVTKEVKEKGAVTTGSEVVV